MKATVAAILSLTITGTQALASAGGATAGGFSLIGTFFIAFAGLIFIFQLIPGIMLLAGMIKGLFSSAARKPGEATAEEGKKH